jgi:hypothetical protein
MLVDDRKSRPAVGVEGGGMLSEKESPACEIDSRLVSKGSRLSRGVCGVRRPSRGLAESESFVLVNVSLGELRD